MERRGKGRSKGGSREALQAMHGEFARPFYGEDSTEFDYDRRPCSHGRPGSSEDPESRCRTRR